MHTTSVLEAQIMILLLLENTCTEESAATIPKTTCRKRMVCNLLAVPGGAAWSTGWIHARWIGFLFPFDPQSIALSLRSLNVIASPSALPGEAPPGSRQRAEDGGEGQSREERVEGEVEQPFHPIIAQAF